MDESGARLAKQISDDTDAPQPELFAHKAPVRRTISRHSLRVRFVPRAAMILAGNPTRLSQPARLSFARCDPCCLFRKGRDVQRSGLRMAKERAVGSDAEKTGVHRAARIRNVAARSGGDLEYSIMYTKRQIGYLWRYGGLRTNNIATRGNAWRQQHQ
jgi:hypothetical protein